MSSSPFIYIRYVTAHLEADAAALRTPLGASARLVSAAHIPKRNGIGSNVGNGNGNGSVVAPTPQQAQAAGQYGGGFGNSVGGASAVVTFSFVCFCAASVGGASALVTFIYVLCTLRMQISRSMCDFSHSSWRSLRPPCQRLQSSL
jgi:hypothetical protein